MEQESTNFIRSIKNRYILLWHWVKPSPLDPLALQIVKTFLRGIIALIIVAISPVIILILGFVFMAAI